MRIILQFSTCLLCLICDRLKAVFLSLKNWSNLKGFRIRGFIINFLMSGHVILKLNEAHQLLLYAREVYPLEVTINTTKITEASVVHSR